MFNNAEDHALKKGEFNEVLNKLENYRNMLQKHQADVFRLRNAIRSWKYTQAYSRQAYSHLDTVHRNKNTYPGDSFDKKYSDLLRSAMSIVEYKGVYDDMVIGEEYKRLLHEIQNASSQNKLEDFLNSDNFKNVLNCLLLIRFLSDKKYKIMVLVALYKLKNEKGVEKFIKEFIDVVDSKDIWSFAMQMYDPKDDVWKDFMNCFKWAIKQHEGGIVQNQKGMELSLSKDVSWRDEQFEFERAYVIAQFLCSEASNIVENIKFYSCHVDLSSVLFSIEYQYAKVWPTFNYNTHTCIVFEENFFDKILYSPKFLDFPFEINAENKFPSEFKEKRELCFDFIPQIEEATYLLGSFRSYSMGSQVCRYFAYLAGVLPDRKDIFPVVNLFGITMPPELIKFLFVKGPDNCLRYKDYYNRYVSSESDYCESIIDKTQLTVLVEGCFKSDLKVPEGLNKPVCWELALRKAQADEKKLLIKVIYLAF